MKPNTTKCTETIVLGRMGWIGSVHCENSRGDFTARTFALIALGDPVLHRVSCSYETIPNAPKYYKWWKPLGFSPDLSMRVGDNSIWGGSTLCYPTTTPQGLRCALATVTPPPICVVLVVPGTTLNLQENRRTSKNKWTRKEHTDLAQRINLIHTKLGFWIEQIGWSNRHTRLQGSSNS